MRGEQVGGQPPRPLVEIPKHDPRPAQVRVPEDLAPDQLARLTATLQEGEPQVDVKDVQQRTAGQLDVCPQAPTPLVPRAANVIITDATERGAAEHHVPVCPPLMLAIFAQAVVIRQFLGKEPRLIVFFVRPGDAHDFLQGDDIGINLTQYVNNTARTHAPVKPATLMDIIRHDTDMVRRASHCHPGHFHNQRPVCFRADNAVVRKRFIGPYYRYSLQLCRSPLTRSRAEHVPTGTLPAAFAVLTLVLILLFFCKRLLTSFLPSRVSEAGRTDKRSAMKSIWNGTISFGLVHIPVKVYSATKANEVNLHYLHEEDLGRITLERVCTRCGQPLEYDELVRGYEYEKGKYVPLTEEDLEQLALESMKNVTITEFVDPHDIDPTFFEKPYYLAPDENGEELYVLLREALKRTRRVGIGKVVWYGREHVVAITASEQALRLNILYFADEIAPPQELTFPGEDVAVGEEEVALAARLVESMSERFAPERYTDTYQDTLRELIAKKRAGIALTPRPARRPPTQVADLMAKLRASVEHAEQERKKKIAA